MEIKIIDNKRDYMDLLLLADEQENMIDKYLDRGDMFALYDGDLKSICVVTDEGEGVFELKNLATEEKYQRQGYGRNLVAYILDFYRGPGRKMMVGTGDSPITIPFYQSCGFVISHRLVNYILDHYDHPIYENGVQLFDVVYLKQDLG